MTHGTADRILPIDQTSRQIHPQLKQKGYDLTYQEFEGGHTVRPEDAREALAWFALGASESLTSAATLQDGLKASLDIGVGGGPG